MDFEKVLGELFADEDRARHMATDLMALAQTSPAEAAKERDRLLAFLRGPMERHMAFEEQKIFPQLVEHGLAEEVGVALKHHAAIRKEAENLAGATTEEGTAQAVFFAARLMVHHTNFEGDYIYPELGREQWRTLMRASIVE